VLAPCNHGSTVVLLQWRSFRVRVDAAQAEPLAA
jgi:hypothetical protein